MYVCVYIYIFGHIIQINIKHIQNELNVQSVKANQCVSVNILEKIKTKTNLSAFVIQEESSCDVIIT